MTRGRAIVVTPRLPWPLDEGGRIGLWQSVWSCAQEWDVTLISLVPRGEERAPLPPALAAPGIEVVRVPHRPPPFPVAAARGAIGRWPYMLARYRSAALEAALSRLVRERSPEFVWFNHLHTATAMDAVRGTAVILREHNLEHLWLERFADGLPPSPTRWYARQQARRTKAVELALCARCDAVLAVQDDERDRLRRLLPGTRVETVPVGIDFARFRPWSPAPEPIVLLAGSFGWAPNADGARRFLAEGWPALRARVPGVTLRMVGRDLPDSLAAFAREAGAEVVGYVDDIAAEFARARLLLVPLWAGAGARVKIVEALAAGMPVVSTPIGAEGLGLAPGRDDLEADTPHGLAEAAAELLLDPARAAAIAASGHRVARQRFSLEEVARLGNAIVAGAVRARLSSDGRAAARCAPLAS